jgi:hypothetical protein
LWGFFLGCPLTFHSARLQACREIYLIHFINLTRWSHGNLHKVKESLQQFLLKFLILAGTGETFGPGLPRPDCCSIGKICGCAASTESPVAVRAPVRFRDCAALCRWRFAGAAIKGRIGTDLLNNKIK